jgi:hypothetical protein
MIGRHPGPTGAASAVTEETLDTACDVKTVTVGSIRTVDPALTDMAPTSADPMPR